VRVLVRVCVSMRFLVSIFIGLFINIQRIRLASQMDEEELEAARQRFLQQRLLENQAVLYANYAQNLSHAAVASTVDHALSAPQQGAIYTNLSASARPSYYDSRSIFSSINAYVSSSLEPKVATPQDLAPQFASTPSCLQQLYSDSQTHFAQAHNEVDSTMSKASNLPDFSTHLSASKSDANRTSSLSKHPLAAVPLSADVDTLASLAAASATMAPYW
jgi:hypothetical protein